MSAATIAQHIPVLRDEVVALLAPHSGGRYIDCTVGGGGHAKAILESSGPDGLLLGLDADPAAIALAEETLAPYGGRVRLVNGNFASMGRIARERDFAAVDGILFDLGLSALQLAAQRGFSFREEVPLDMRFDPRGPLSAAELVNELPEPELADLMRRYGEEPRARVIARRIVQERPIRTASQLARIVAAAVGGRRGAIHPATRTFQALRIAVNQELDNLAAALPQAVQLLRAGGRLVVLSYHSLEDRIVKNFFRTEAAAEDGPPRLAILTPKPLRPTAIELARNPRCRSAKLRAAQRL